MKKLLLSLCAAILLAIPASSITSAATLPENYTQKDSHVNDTKVQPLRPSGVEAMYPMSAEAEGGYCTRGTDAPGHHRRRQV